MEMFYFIARYFMYFFIPLLVVSISGMFSERSGIINLALEGIMIFGAFMGVLFVRSVQQFGWFAHHHERLQDDGQVEWSHADLHQG